MRLAPGNRGVDAADGLYDNVQRRIVEVYRDTC
jgi:hypothetical protein